MTALNFARSIWAATGGDAGFIEHLAFAGAGSLASEFPVSDLAAASIGAAGLAVAQLLASQNAVVPAVTVDRRLASIWFLTSIRPQGWKLPSPWDPIAGDYQAQDGWIRLHTNAPQHRAAAMRVLGPQTERATMAQAVARWSKFELETAVVKAGGCAAEMRSIGEWESHPQGQAVAGEKLMALALSGQDDWKATSWKLGQTRPLQGVRVLDLTRVLAGPVASRFLAGYGADVLRIDPPDWDEAIVPEVTLGKNCARLDLRDKPDRAVFEALLAQADVLIHGYRPGALEKLGLGEAARRRLAPGLIDVSLDAYGWSGPWHARRGFDSLLQMSTGIADLGMRAAGAAAPVPLPVQALDHATGYLLAAAAINGLTERLRCNRGTMIRASLARTAKLLIDHRGAPPDEKPAPDGEADWAREIELTDWGPARRVLPPVDVAGARMHWDLPARGLGTALPAWREQAASGV